jgi:hypothetical protein
LPGLPILKESNQAISYNALLTPNFYKVIPAAINDGDEKEKLKTYQAAV